MKVLFALIVMVTVVNARDHEPRSIYRLYNEVASKHHYTADENERRVLTSLGWNFEGVAFIALEDPGSPAKRLIHSYCTNFDSYLHVAIEAISDGEIETARAQYDIISISRHKFIAKINNNILSGYALEKLNASYNEFVNKVEALILLTTEE